MWPLLVLLLLGFLSCGSSQLLFTTIESVEYTNDNKTILIPCLVTNVEAKSLREMFVKWKFGDTHIFYYDGDKNESKPIKNFSSAYIIPDALLTGIASLMMDKSQAAPGNYTCEVTELTREGETTVELKYIAGYSLQCYTCHNPVGSCTVINNCTVNFDACLYVKAETRTLYQCWKFENCNYTYLSKLIGEKSLHYECCQKDLCNKSSGTSITGTIALLVTPLLTAFWRLLI